MHDLRHEAWSQSVRINVLDVKLSAVSCYMLCMRIRIECQESSIGLLAHSLYDIECLMQEHWWLIQVHYKPAIWLADCFNPHFIICELIDRFLSNLAPTHSQKWKVDEMSSRVRVTLIHWRLLHSSHCAQKALWMFCHQSTLFCCQRLQVVARIRSCTWPVSITLQCRRESIVWLAAPEGFWACLHVNVYVLCSRSEKDLRHSLQRLIPAKRLGFNLLTY